MADDNHKKRGPRSSIPWLKIRTDFLNGETDFAALGKKYGIARETISRKATADKKAGQEWASRKEIHHAIVTDVTSRIASRVAAEEGARVAEELLAIGEASKLAAEYTKDILTKAKTGEITPGEKQSAADVFNTVMAGYARFVTTVREDHGIRAGQSSVPTEAGSDSIFRFIVVKDEQIA
jgi:hypothetical protein